jgi:hypothetical protein
MNGFAPPRQLNRDALEPNLGKESQMKRLALALVPLLLAAFHASAQTMQEEVARVRDQLGVSESTPITLADSPTLPTANPLRLYLALGLDMEVRKRTIERIDDWNKHDAQKYGALNIVSELSQADVILIHFSARDRAYSKVRGTEGNIHTTTYIPGNSYIVVPKGTGYEVLWRYQGKSIERKHGPGVPGQTMRDHFFDMLKHRNK